MSEKTDLKTKRDLWLMICSSSLLVIVLVGVMIFSPLASQFNEKAVFRGGGSEWELDSLMQSKEYQKALAIVDAEIEEMSCGLPRFAYFDRFLSEEERYDASIRRAEIYDLQWKRIEILEAKNDVKALKEALRDYSSVIGYNQTSAKTKLNQLKKK